MERSLLAFCHVKLFTQQSLALVKNNCYVNVDASINICWERMLGFHKFHGEKSNITSNVTIYF